jgi:hypothetical protein
LRLWDALLKALGQRGWTAAIEGEYWRPKTVLEKDGAKVYVRMVENSVRTLHVPTAEERERMKKSPHFHDVPEYDVKATDELAFGL